MALTLRCLSKPHDPRRCRLAAAQRLAIHASCTPCHIARADLLRLLTLAGFDHTTVAWREVLAGADDPELVMPDAVLMMIEWATTPEGERGG